MNTSSPPLLLLSSSPLLLLLIVPSPYHTILTLSYHILASSIPHHDVIHITLYPPPYISLSPTMITSLLLSLFSFYSCSVFIYFYLFYIYFIFILFVVGQPKSKPLKATSPPSMLLSLSFHLHLPFPTIFLPC